MIDAKTIEELRGLLAKATPGPWKNHLVDDTTIVASNGFEIGTTWPGGSVYNGFVDPAEQHEINAALIVAMRNAIPALLDAASRALINKPKGGDVNAAVESRYGDATSPGVTAGASAQHASDCAVHNEPAYPKGPCNCGASTEELCKRSELAEAQCEKWAETASRQAERIDALTAEIERLRAPPKWRPIATAPKDGGEDA